MASFVSSDGSKIINISLLTGFMKIFATDTLAADFELSLLNAKKFSDYVVPSETAPSRNLVEVL